MLPGGGGVEEPAQRMREREGAIEPRLGRSAARRHLGRERERDKGEGGTKVRSRQGREEWRRRRRRRRVSADAEPHAREPPSPLPVSWGRFNFLALYGLAPPEISMQQLAIRLCHATERRDT